MFHGTDKMQKGLLCQISGFLIIPGLITAEPENIVIILFCNGIQIFSFSSVDFPDHFSVVHSGGLLLYRF